MITDSDIGAPRRRVNCGTKNKMIAGNGRRVTKSVRRRLPIAPAEPHQEIIFLGKPESTSHALADPDRIRAFRAGQQFLISTGGTRPAFGAPARNGDEHG
jgi:hypothetical protein